jgi:hypothetical protein
VSGVLGGGFGSSLFLPFTRFFSGVLLGAGGGVDFLTLESEADEKSRLCIDESFSFVTSWPGRVQAVIVSDAVKPAGDPAELDPEIDPSLNLETVLLREGEGVNDTVLSSASS